MHRAEYLAFAAAQPQFATGPLRGVDRSRHQRPVAHALLGGAVDQLNTLRRHGQHLAWQGEQALGTEAQLCGGAFQAGIQAP